MVPFAVGPTQPGMGLLWILLIYSITVFPLHHTLAVPLKNTQDNKPNVKMSPNGAVDFRAKEYINRHQPQQFYTKIASGVSSKREEGYMDKSKSDHFKKLRDEKNDDKFMGKGYDGFQQGIKRTGETGIAKDFLSEYKYKHQSPGKNHEANSQTTTTTSGSLETYLALWLINKNKETKEKDDGDDGDDDDDDNIVSRNRIQGQHASRLNGNEAGHTQTRDYIISDVQADNIDNPIKSHKKRDVKSENRYGYTDRLADDLTQSYMSVPEDTIYYYYYEDPVVEADTSYPATGPHTNVRHGSYNGQNNNKNYFTNNNNDNIIFQNDFMKRQKGGGGRGFREKSGAINSKRISEDFSDSKDVSRDEETSSISDYDSNRFPQLQSHDFSKEKTPEVTETKTMTDTTRRLPAETIVSSFNDIDRRPTTNVEIASENSSPPTAEDEEEIYMNVKNQVEDYHGVKPDITPYSRSVGELAQNLTSNRDKPKMNNSNSALSLTITVRPSFESSGDKEREESVDSEEGNIDIKDGGFEMEEKNSNKTLSKNVISGDIKVKEDVDSEKNSVSPLFRHGDKMFEVGDGFGGNNTENIPYKLDRNEVKISQKEKPSQNYDDDDDDDDGDDEDDNDDGTMPDNRKDKKDDVDENLELNHNSFTTDDTTYKMERDLTRAPLSNNSLMLTDTKRSNKQIESGISNTNNVQDNTTSQVVKDSENNNIATDANLHLPSGDQDSEKTQTKDQNSERNQARDQNSQRNQTRGQNSQRNQARDQNSERNQTRDQNSERNQARDQNSERNQTRGHNSDAITTNRNITNHDKDILNLSTTTEEQIMSKTNITNPEIKKVIFDIELNSTPIQGIKNKLNPDLEETGSRFQSRHVDKDTFIPPRPNTKNKMATNAKEINGVASKEVKTTQSNGDITTTDTMPRAEITTPIQQSNEQSNAPDSPDVLVNTTLTAPQEIVNQNNSVSVIDGSFLESLNHTGINEVFVINTTETSIPTRENVQSYSNNSHKFNGVTEADNLEVHNLTQSTKSRRIVTQVNPTLFTRVVSDSSTEKDTRLIQSVTYSTTDIGVALNKDEVQTRIAIKNNETISTDEAPHQITISKNSSSRDLDDGTVESNITIEHENSANTQETRSVADSSNTTAETNSSFIHHSKTLQNNFTSVQDSTTPLSENQSNIISLKGNGSQLQFSPSIQNEQQTQNSIVEDSLNNINVTGIQQNRSGVSEYENKRRVAPSKATILPSESETIVMAEDSKNETAKEQHNEIEIQTAKLQTRDETVIKSHDEKQNYTLLNETKRNVLTLAEEEPSGVSKEKQHQVFSKLSDSSEQKGLPDQHQRAPAARKSVNRLTLADFPSLLLRRRPSSSLSSNKQEVSLGGTREENVGVHAGKMLISADDRDVEVEVPRTSAYMAQDFSLRKPEDWQLRSKENPQKKETDPATNTQSRDKRQKNGVTQETKSAALAATETESESESGSDAPRFSMPQPSASQARAAVSAVLTSHFGPTKQQIIPFDLELLDLADNYDNATGMFIATIPGTYVISVYLMSHPGAKVNARVYVNDRPVAALWADDTAHAGFYPSSSIQTISQLGFGDQVYVMLVDGGYGDSWVHANYNVFTIFLLYEETFS